MNPLRGILKSAAAAGTLTLILTLIGRVDTMRKTGEPTAAEKRKATCEVAVCKRFLKRQMGQVGEKLADYRVEKEQWKIAKADKG